MALVNGRCLVVAKAEAIPGTLEPMDPALDTHALIKFELDNERGATTQEPLLPYRGDRPPIQGERTPTWSSEYHIAGTTVFLPYVADLCKEYPFFAGAGFVRDPSLDVVGSAIAPYGTHEISLVLDEQAAQSMSAADAQRGTDFEQIITGAGLRSGFRIRLEYAKPFTFENTGGKGVLYSYDDTVAYPFDTNNLGGLENTQVGAVKTPRTRYRIPVSCLNGTGVLMAMGSDGLPVYEYPFGTVGRGIRMIEVDGRSELATPRTMEGAGGVAEVLNVSRKPVAIKFQVMACPKTDFDPDYICDNNLRMFISYSVDCVDNFPGETDYVGLDCFCHPVGWKKTYQDNVMFWEIEAEVTARDLSTNAPGALRIFKGTRYA